MPNFLLQSLILQFPPSTNHTSEFANSPNLHLKGSDRGPMPPMALALHPFCFPGPTVNLLVRPPSIPCMFKHRNRSLSISVAPPLESRLAPPCFQGLLLPATSSVVCVSALQLKVISCPLHSFGGCPHGRPVYPTHTRPTPGTYPVGGTPFLGPISTVALGQKLKALFNSIAHGLTKEPALR